MEKILIIPILISFFITLFTMPFWIKRSKKIGLIWEDMNKPGHPKEVGGSGGLITLFGFIFGVLIYIAIKTFILKTDLTTVDIFASMTTILIAGIVGLVDDFLGWTHGGLSAKIRIVLLFFAAIPLMVVNSGESVMMGIEFGIFYPLLFIPLGVIGASATFNFLAGYNGLESVQGMLLLSALAIATYFTQNSWLSIICLCMIVCLIAFLVYNWYPAKIFPGNVLTYSVGALIATTAIIGNIEKIAVFFFIPYIIETVLKIRGKLKKQCFGRVNEDKSLDVPYDKFYSLTHISIFLLKKLKKSEKAYEREVVFVIGLFQIFIILIGFILFRSVIF